MHVKRWKAWATRTITFLTLSFWFNHPGAYDFAIDRIWFCELIMSAVPIVMQMIRPKTDAIL
jgi:hypothetical protein